MLESVKRNNGRIHSSLQSSKKNDWSTKYIKSNSSWFTASENYDQYNAGIIDKKSQDCDVAAIDLVFHPLKCNQCILFNA